MVWFLKDSCFLNQKSDTIYIDKKVQQSTTILGGASGSVVECLTRDQEAAGLSLTGVTALWSLSMTNLSWLSTGSTKEDSSLFNWKIVDGT